MNVDAIITALALPEGTRVGQRVPKKLLLQQGKPSAADKRLIQDAVSELTWVAALKRTNIGVPAHEDEAREYLEIAVLSVALKAAVRSVRLEELIHRAVPYPVVLVTSQGKQAGISLAHKRRSQTEADAVVLETGPITVTISPEDSPAIVDRFLSGIALAEQPKIQLRDLYQGWITQVEAFLASRITGTFSAAGDERAAIARREALESHGRLQREIAALRGQAAKEKQMGRRVELNLTIRRLEAELAAATSHL